MAESHPACWGKQYEENCRECEKCELSATCKPTWYRNNGIQIAQAPNNPPVFAPQIHPPAWAVNHQTPSVAQRIPTAPPSPQIMPYPQVPVPQVQPYPAVPQVPIPMQPQQVATRDYSTQSLHDFTPFPGETIPGRLGKNIVLKSVSGISYIVGTELSRFFGIWRWPPRNN